MDAWALNLNTGGLSFVATKRRAIEEVGGVNRFGFKRVSEFGFKRVSVTYRSLVASGKKKNHENNDSSIPEGDGPEGINPANDKSKSDESAQRSNPSLLDWRDFRANLVNSTRDWFDPAAATKDPTSDRPPCQPLGPKWAHPIAFPEPGCVLVATEKLDGVRSFERTVVLLLRLGTRDLREGPFGVIINRPFHKKMENMSPTNAELATTFSDCPLYFGGPLDTSMFLIKTSEAAPVPGFEPVVPGVCFGARNSLDEAARLVRKGVLRAEDFRFFVGYAGWQLDQLMEEIESDYWVVAACSSQLIAGGGASANSSGLWEEILQLMGGRYSELSRKPKQDT